MKKERKVMRKPPFNSKRLKELTGGHNSMPRSSTKNNPTPPLVLTYRNRSIHSLHVAFIHQDLSSSQTECFNFSFPQIFAPLQSFNLLVQTAVAAACERCSCHIGRQRQSAGRRFGRHGRRRRGHGLFLLICVLLLTTLLKMAGGVHGLSFSILLAGVLLLCRRSPDGRAELFSPSR